jgi:hypothetical protein
MSAMDRWRPTPMSTQWIATLVVCAFVLGFIVAKIFHV